MTKEDFFRQNFPEYCRGDTFLSPYWDLFEAGYELKQNILSQHILELQADKGELTDRVKELEAQNEANENGAKKYAGYYFKTNDNLTTAKEIIKKLLEEEKSNMYWEMNGSDKSSYYEVRKQAEQFLKETK